MCVHCACVGGSSGEGRGGWEIHRRRRGRLSTVAFSASERQFPAQIEIGTVRYAGRRNAWLRVCLLSRWMAGMRSFRAGRAGNFVRGLFWFSRPRSNGVSNVKGGILRTSPRAREIFVCGDGRMRRIELVAVAATHRVALPGRARRFRHCKVSLYQKTENACEKAGQAAAAAKAPRGDAISSYLKYKHAMRRH